MYKVCDQRWTRRAFRSRVEAEVGGNGSGEGGREEGEKDTGQEEKQELGGEGGEQSNNGEKSEKVNWNSIKNN